MTSERKWPLESLSTAQPSVGSRDLTRVLFFTDNGHGLGHLTRMSAVAQESQGRFQPVFLTLSGGFPLLRGAGIPAEFSPSYSQIGLSKQEWSPLLAMRVAEAVRLTGARVVIVDHVMPPSSFGLLKAATTGVQFVWSRRGLWRAHRNEDYLGMMDDFHTVVEPADLAGPIDLGATVRQRHKVQHVGPVVLLQPYQYLPREVARKELGLPADGRVVLVQLSDSRVSRLKSLIRRAQQVIAEASGSELVHVFAPVHPLHRDVDLADIDGVVMAPAYPIAAYFNAFDGVISTAGYNSFHEIVVSGLPAVFVARDTGSLDDQERRARFAEFCGRAIWAPSLDDPAFEQAVDRMLRPEEPGIASATTRELGPLLGAREFADLIERLARDAQSQKFAVGDVEMRRETREALATKLASGATAGNGAVEAVIIVAVEHTTQQLNTLVSEVDELQASRPQTAPVFLIREASSDALADRDFIFESVMTPNEWDVVSPETPYNEYLRSRISGLQRRYAAHQVSEPEPGSTAVEDLERLARSSSKT